MAKPRLARHAVVLAEEAVALKRLMDSVQQILIVERLVRNSSAPAFIALTDMGISPRPVMKMIGM
jgi:hypothetical protein